MYGIYFQLLSRLVQQPGMISQLDSYRTFIRTMIQWHQCLESTCHLTRFQLGFFGNTILLQEILACTLNHSSKLFFDDLFVELGLSSSKYASLVFLSRCIDAMEINLLQENKDLALHWMDHSISHLFQLLDQCQYQIVIPAVLPVSFGKTQVEYGTLYDVIFSLLMKLLSRQPLQVLLSSMTQLIQPSRESMETPSIVSTSVQLASELIIQSYLLYHLSWQFQELFALFLAELLRSDLHASLVQHLLTMPNLRTVKCRAYEALLCSNSFSRVHELLSSFFTGEFRPFISKWTQRSASAAHLRYLSLFHPTVSLSVRPDWIHLPNISSHLTTSLLRHCHFQSRLTQISPGTIDTDICCPRRRRRGGCSFGITSSLCPSMQSTGRERSRSHLRFHAHQSCGIEVTVPGLPSRLSRSSRCIEATLLAQCSNDWFDCSVDCSLWQRTSSLASAQSSFAGKCRSRLEKTCSKGRQWDLWLSINQSTSSSPRCVCALISDDCICLLLAIYSSASSWVTWPMAMRIHYPCEWNLNVRCYVPTLMNSKSVKGLLGTRQQQTPSIVFLLNPIEHRPTMNVTFDCNRVGSMFIISKQSSSHAARLMPSSSCSLDLPIESQALCCSASLRHSERERERDALRVIDTSELLYLRRSQHESWQWQIKFSMIFEMWTREILFVASISSLRGEERREEKKREEGERGKCCQQ